MEDLLHTYLGSNSESITWWQMTLRAGVIFLWGLALVRFGGRRIFGRHTSFDIVLAVILGSNLSRALTANAPLVATLVASTALVVLHGILAKLALHSTLLGRAIKGTETRLVADGEIDWKAMKKASMTEHDLNEALRLQDVDHVRKVKAAYLERSGKVSVVKRR